MEFRNIGQMANIAPSPESQVVHAPNLVSTFKQSVTEVTADETCAAGHQNSHSLQLTPDT